jgi:hypothetical protein
MRHLPSLLRTLVPVFAAGLPLGCGTGPAGSTETTEAPVQPVQEAMMGPQGGTIEGTANGPFAGVRVEVPAGALAAMTRVRLLSVVDGTAMPPLAERVGPQFELDTGGAPLAMPVRLTLPVVAGIVERFGQGPGDVKVWIRAGEGWMLQPAVATAEGSVTISLATPTTFAAGVTALVRPLTCSITEAPRCIDPQIDPQIDLRPPCTSPTGFCITAIPSVAPRPTSTFALDADSTSFVYPAVPTRGNMVVVRRAFDARGVLSTTVSQALTGAPATFAADIEIDPLGGVWIGGGSVGNVRFRFDNAVQRLDFDAVGDGAVVTTDGTLVRSSSAGTTARINGVFAERIESGIETLRFLRAGAAADPTSPRGYWVMGPSRNNDELVRIIGGTGHQDDSFRVPAHVQADSRITVAPNGAVAVMIQGRDGVSSRREVFVRNGRDSRVIEGLPPVFDIEYDRQGTLWMASLNTPEIFTLSPAGELTTVALANATADPAEFAARIPRAIRAQVAATVIVMTQGREFFQLRRSTN